MKECERLMRLNRGGLILCANYVVSSVPLMLLARNAADDKGAYVFNQLAVAPAGMLFTYTGAIDLVMQYPWVNSIPVFFFVSLCSVVRLAGPSAGLGGACAPEKARAMVQVRSRRLELAAPGPTPQ
jgi:hypothetical protein